jgi:hypothetical protein
MSPEIIKEDGFKEVAETEAIVIEIESRFDPDCKMACPFDSTPTEQKKINYGITINDQRFVAPGVWASVCPEGGESFFAPEVGNAIMGRIFEIQHPQRALLSKLMGGEINDE